MTGTISLYDGEGERLHTIYLGATPEYGKGRFVARLEGEIAHVRSLYPSATYVGVADGAQCNWDILSGHTDEQILDFYHASGYVGDAAKAAYPGDESERARWIRERCHALKHRQGAASRILKQMRAIDTRGLSAERRDKLDAAITYFANHKHQMHYSRYRKQSLPIGSGVTEAACKTLIKQRLCQGDALERQGCGDCIESTFVHADPRSVATILGEARSVRDPSTPLNPNIRSRSHPMKLPISSSSSSSYGTPCGTRRKIFQDPSWQRQRRRSSPTYVPARWPPCSLHLLFWQSRSSLTTPCRSR